MVSCVTVALGSTHRECSRHRNTMAMSKQAVSVLAEVLERRPPLSGHRLCRHQAILRMGGQQSSPFGASRGPHEQPPQHQNSLRIMHSRTEQQVSTALILPHQPCPRGPSHPSRTQHVPKDVPDTGNQVLMQVLRHALEVPARQDDHLPGVILQPL